MWKKLVNIPNILIERGFLLRFPTEYPFENEVVMMVSGYPDDGHRLSGVSLITITGYKAGINAFVVFPKEVRSFGSLTSDWLIKNWTKWVCPDGDVNDVWVREPLQVSEIFTAEPQ